MTTKSDSKQRYVLGSHVPGFFWGQDLFPNSVAPDVTDFSHCTIRQVQFRLTEDGQAVPVDASAKTETIDGTSRAGLEVSATDMVASLTSAGGKWFWRFAGDLAGDGKMCYSEWQQFSVYR